MLNPIIIIELDDLSDLEFDISNIFKYIKFHLVHLIMNLVY